ncbi:hypothetical protein JQ625_10850 [Bradyrhizobium diazoefficiens]|nr:hypothetical protein [Bradyrhizobium diazoefficiens]MBR0775330.1 hypothetical protein [Bradyrhizobium diazoefficiens]
MAAFGILSATEVAAGVGGGETTARRKQAHCKFIIVVYPRSKYFREFNPDSKIQVFATGTLIANDPLILGKTGKRFNREARLTDEVNARRDRARHRIGFAACDGEAAV